MGKKKTPRETQFPHQVPEGVSESCLLRLRSIIRLEINAVAGNGACAVSRGTTGWLPPVTEVLVVRVTHPPSEPFRTIHSRLHWLAVRAVYG